MQVTQEDKEVKHHTGCCQLRHELLVVPCLLVPVGLLHVFRYLAVLREPIRPGVNFYRPEPFELIDLSLDLKGLSELLHVLQASILLVLA